MTATGARGFPLCSYPGCRCESIGPAKDRRPDVCYKHWTAEIDPAGAQSAYLLGLLTPAAAS